MLLEAKSVIMDVAAPVLLMVAAGFFLRRIKLINDEFIFVSSKFVFKVCMPTLLFLGLYSNNLSGLIRLHFALYFVLAILLTFLLAWFLAIRLSLPSSQRGVFVQIAFRGNCGVFSLALAVNMFGQEGVAIGGVMSGLSVLLFNILAEIILTRYSHGSLNVGAMLKNMAKNPLILAIIFGVLANLWALHLPLFMVKTGTLIGNMTLPLALLCIGGALATSGLKLPRFFSFAILCKVLISPFLFTSFGFLLGFTQKELLFLFLFLSAPTAASAYVSAVSKGDDGKSTANAIARSTLISSVVIVVCVPIIVAFTGG